MDSRNELFDEIYFDCQPSCLLLIIFCSIAMGSCWVVWSVQLSIWIKVLLFIFFVGYSYKILSRDILLCSGASVDRFSYLAPHARWRLYLKNGYLEANRLHADSLVTRYIVILRFKPLGGRCVSICLLPGSLSRIQFKSLHRVLYLCKKQSII